MTKHTKEPWTEDFVYDHEGCGCCTSEFDEADRLRIVQCVNACAGIDDPESEIQSLRTKLKSLRTWIIENTVDVEGQDGTKWNCIERDEILEYLNERLLP